jgi:aspartate-semialdehyde dehydrogenase
MEQRIKVGILGATGMVGQRFVELLTDHPWFEVSYLAASEKSTRKSYEAACAWKLPIPMPDWVKNLKVEDAIPQSLDARIVFSALDSAVAGPIEESFARAGYVVVSNASSDRMAEDVPLLIPEINSDHLALIEVQKKNRNYGSGFLIKNPNCSTITLSLALSPLEREFGIESVFVSTMQAVSGAGYPGVASLDILGNVIPFIAGEEDKIERETRKIFGRVLGKTVESHPMIISAQTSRVAVIDGHMETVFVKLRKKASIEKIRQSFQQYKSIPQELKLPTAPKHPVILKEEVDHPQPRLDLTLEKGMATIVGRLRPCTMLDARFVILGHNTIRGAAGAAVLNAELLKVKGLL